MNNITTKLVVPLATLFAYVHLLFGCGPQPVTAREIDRANTDIVQLLKSALLLSRDTTSSVDAAYRDLSLYLNSNNLSLPEITSLEDHRSTVKGQAGRLREVLKKAQGRADYLFSLLKRRTEENQSPDLKDEMFRLIGLKEADFNKTVQEAVDEIGRLDLHVQRYDDIVGYAQVRRGLAGIGPIKAEVIAIRQEAFQINQALELRISNGLIIANSIQISQRE